MTHVPIGDPPYHLPQWPPVITPYVAPAPRTMPVNVPFSNFGVTVVTMDREGNITIKVDQVANP